MFEYLGNLEGQRMASSNASSRWIDDATFRADIDYLDTLWQRRRVGQYDLPVIDIGEDAGDGPVVCVPILEHLDFVYSRQVRDLSKTHRVLFYRRHESRTRPVNASERVEELRAVLDSQSVERANFIAHGDAAIVLIEFAIRYPQRCRSLTLLVQGPDYVIAPHPFIWILHELFLRLPVEHILPTPFLSRIVTNYATARSKENTTRPSVPRHLIERQFGTISRWPAVYKFSVLPVIHTVDFYERLAPLTMPVLVLNRHDDRLTPEPKTRWLAGHLPNCAGYFVVDGGERFFMYAQSAVVNPIIERFLAQLAETASV
jgi:pimeloyl-ACP methyl ester carboxylesterase